MSDAVAGAGAVGALAACGAVAALVVAAPAPAGDAAFPCRPSVVGGRPVPGRTSFNLGSSRLAAALPPRATFAAVRAGSRGAANAILQHDGWIRAKLGWWTAGGTLRLAGRRLDAPARPLRASVGPRSWTAAGAFVPSLLTFPSVGCWRITATAGGARLVATVRVVRR